MSHIAGRTAIVTGASSGIGLAIATTLAAAGARVVLAARRPQELAAVADGIRDRGGDALAVPTDVTREDDVIALFDEAERGFEGVDMLVNVAGMADHTPTTELTLERWERVLAVNLTAAMLCSREALRRMKDRGHGRIVNIGSASAYRPRADNAAYAASKFGLVGLTHSLALDGRAFGVTASVMHPGVTQSNLMGGGWEVGPTMMSADDVARIVLLHVDLPDDVNLFESFALPIGMPFLGRG